MAIIAERERGIIKTRFDKDLVNDVKLLFFTQRESPLFVPGRAECRGCRDEQQLLTELADISPKVHLEVHDFLGEADKALVQQHGIEEIPALVITANGSGGVRFFGLTTGYEFAALLEDILDVSKGTTSLSAQTKEQLAKVDEPLHIRVFVTPT